MSKDTFQMAGTFILAFLLLAGSVYCAVLQIQIPEWLMVADGTVVGYFFSRVSAEQGARLALAVPPIVAAGGTMNGPHA